MTESAARGRVLGRMASSARVAKRLADLEPVILAIKDEGATSLYQIAQAGLSLQPRELIKPEEVRTRMRGDEAIFFARGAAAIRCGRAAYFRRPEMAKRIKADPKP